MIHRHSILGIATLILGAVVATGASAADTHHHRKPVPVHHHHAARSTHHAASATYGAPNRQPLSSGDSPTTPREGHVVDPLSIPGSDAAIYNWSPDDKNSPYGY